MMKFAYSVLAFAVVPLATAHALPVAVVADARSDADTLVAQLVADDAMVKLGSRAFDSGLEAKIAADPVAARANSSVPGLKEYVAGQLRGEFVKILLRELPGLRRQISAVLSADLTGPEIADTLTFFRSPVGQKIKARAYASVGSKPDQSPEQVRQAAMAAVLSSLVPEDYPALMAFAASSAGQKMQTLNPKITAASQAWANKLVTDNEPRMRALAAQSVREFFSRKSKS